MRSVNGVKSIYKFPTMNKIREVYKIGYTYVDIGIDIVIVTNPKEY